MGSIQNVLQAVVLSISGLGAAVVVSVLLRR
jgi:hypothetical protein